MTKKIEIKHKCKECARVSKWYMGRSKKYAKDSKYCAEKSKYYAEKCRCDE